MTRHVWIDATAGIAGDMLLGALLDAGADLDRVNAAVGAVLPQAVRVLARPVTRAGLRANKVEIDTEPEQHPHRSWADLRALLGAATLPDRVLSDALTVFGRLAEAEGAVHGIPAEQVHFHEVGAWDSVADVVGVCAALADLGVETLSCSAIELGSGSVAAAHGRLAVPVPAVLRLVAGLAVTGAGSGECATPTGAALLAALCSGQGGLPALTVRATGLGAGTRDPVDHANVVRVVIGDLTGPARGGETLVVLETNVDDLDPRAWPHVLEALLAAGAADAWLSPVVMKKGRPAHTLHVLGAPTQRDALRDTVFRHTSTLGIREHEVCRPALARCWVTVDVAGHQVRIKLGARDGVIVTATAEFEDVAGAAAATGRPVADLLDAARAAAVAAGLTPGRPAPR